MYFGILILVVVMMRKLGMDVMSYTKSEIIYDESLNRDFQNYYYDLFIFFGQIIFT